MLNKKLNLERFASEYEKLGRIVIHDFFEKKMANVAYRSLLNFTQKQYWYQASCGDPYFYSPKIQGKRMAQAHFGFRYQIYPLVNEKPEHNLFRKTRVDTLKNASNSSINELGKDHPLTQIGEFFNSDQMHLLISFITGRELYRKKAVLSISNYRPGDYLTSHDDVHGYRRVTLVLYLTKGWLVHWGGNLAFLNSSYNQIEDTLTPEFNSLVLFNSATPHAVLPVSNYAQVPRFTISGWYMGPTPNKKKK